MAFIGGIILIACILLALPHLKLKDIAKVILGMALVVLIVSVLWWLAVPIAIVWFIFFVTQKVYRAEHPPES